MRFFNSLRNSGVAFVGQIVTNILGILIRWFFIHKLGQEYLGVNGVMESMLAILSMTELGIGTSVAFALYKPIDEGDERRIGSLMAFYRKTYHIIGIITAVIGPVLIPFMKFFTKEAANVEGLTLIYLLFLFNTVISYFFSYKRTLISAYQQNYINSITEDLFAVLKYLLQAVALVCFGSYIGYILINIICAIGTNIVISVICDKKYPFIKKYKKEALAPDDLAGLKKSIISLMYQRIGAKLVMGTDNLMISYAKLVLMGIYSNYAMVVSIVTRIVYNVLHSVVGSVGNLLIQKDSKLKYKVYKEFSFVTFCFFLFISMGFSACLERFIVIWAGKDWLLSSGVTFLVIMNFFLSGMRQTNVIIIEAAGLFNRMRLKAVLEVVVNLVVSFIFLIVFKMGIYGVLLGTTVSMVGVCIWWELAIVFKHSLGVSPKKYIITHICYHLVALTGCFGVYFIQKAIPIDGILGLILSGLCATALFAVVILIIYGKSPEFSAILKRFKVVGKNE